MAISINPSGFFYFFMQSEKLALNEIPLKQFRDVTTVQYDNLSSLRCNIILYGRTVDCLWTNENAEQKLHLFYQIIR